MQPHYIPINRTARFYTLGPTNPAPEEIWFVLHGYGQLARYFIRHFETIDNGKRLIVAPEALSRFYVGRDPERIGATWMTREDRESEIEDYLAYLNQVAAHIFDSLENRSKPVTVLGFSQGATTASRWVTLGKFPANRLILWAGPIAHDLDLNQYGQVFSTMQTAFVVGSKDHFITHEALAKERHRMDAHGIVYTHELYEGTHRMHTEVLEKLADGK